MQTDSARPARLFRFEGKFTFERLSDKRRFQSAIQGVKRLHEFSVPNAVSELTFTHRAADGKKFPALCRHAAARVPSESQPCSQAFVECLKISRGENAD
jgi:hypothetical protein